MEMLVYRNQNDWQVLQKQIYITYDSNEIWNILVYQ